MQFVWSIGGGSRCRVIRACVCYLVQTFCTEQRFQTFRAQLGGECRELTTDMKSSFLPLLVFSLSHSVMSNSLQPHGLYSPWNYLGQNTGVGSLSLLQGIFPTQGLNPGLPCCRRILYQLSHKGSPGILEWVAYPFSRWFSWPRNRAGVFCIAGGFFTNWAIRRACCFPLVKIVCSYLSRNRLVFFISHCLNSIYRGLPPPRLEHQCYLRIEPQINVWI